MRQHFILFLLISLAVSCKQQNKAERIEESRTQDSIDIVLEKPIEPAADNVNSEESLLAELVLNENEIFVLDSVVQDLNNDGTTDKIYLYQMIENEMGDYQRIKILLDNSTELIDEYFPWVVWNEEGDYVNILNSKGVTYILCKGYQFASDPPYLSVYKVEGTQMEKVFGELALINSISITSDTLFSYNKYLVDTLDDAEAETFYFITK